MLSLRDVSVRYGAGRRALTAVDGVDLDIPTGSVVGLVGESGSGKSTFAKAIVGLVPLAGGSITLVGESITGHSRAARDRRRDVQVVFQDPYSSLDRTSSRVGSCNASPSPVPSPRSRGC